MRHRSLCNSWFRHQKSGNQYQYVSRHGFALLVFSTLVLNLLGSAGCVFTARGADNKPSESEPKTGVRFADTTAVSGLRYRWEIPGKRPLNILQTIGNGCAFLDYNGDGNLDVLLVGTKPALFQGDGKGKFTDVSEPSGVAKLSGHFLGCAVGDYNNDGTPDIYLSGWREGRLLENNGQTFTDVSKQAGIKPQPWGTSCALTDMDGDGRLDLYVANYADFGPNTEPQLCRDGEFMTSCGPRLYTPLPGVFLRNEGGMRFRDVTREAGAKTTGRGLGVATIHLDSETRATIAVANDEIKGDLLRPVKNAKTVRFTNDAVVANIAYDRDGNVHGGMGTDWGDYDNDGRFDLFVATFRNEVKSLYQNQGDGTFLDRGYATGLAEGIVPLVTFGAKFVDFENDGFLDLALANGHVQDNIEQIDKTTQYRQSITLLRSNGARDMLRFDDVTGTQPETVRRPLVGRGLAVGDYDNDGRTDLLVVDSEGEPMLLHNESGLKHHFVGVQLEGSKSNRDGYGAVVTVEAGGKKWVRHCHSDGSYMSASDKRVLFGLGETTKVDKLTIRWPSGKTQTVSNVPVDQYTKVREE